MSTQVLSMRVSKETKKRLDRYSRSIGKKPSETGVSLLEESLRRIDHPYIDFRNSRIGRQAYLKGSRLAIWYIIQVAEDYSFSIPALCEHFSLSETKIKAALLYAEKYSGELKQAIKDTIEEEEVSLRGLLPHLTSVYAENES